MAKVVFGKLAAAKSSRDKRRKVMTLKKVRGENGIIQRRILIDAASERFGEEVETAFGKSVRKARRENKLTTGSPEGWHFKR